MSATTPAASVLPPAPWKSTFNQQISKMESPEFVLSTVTAAPAGSPVPYVPRARFCIFRGFWTELPENKHNDAEKNPKAFESDCPTFTTDVRMEKVGQLFGTGAGHAEKSTQIQGSGGGGPVEAVWWIKETSTQWRISGKAFVVAEDIEGDEDSSGVRTVKSEVGKRMRVVDESKESDWSWNRELTATFGNQSPGIQASFRGPPPGKPVTEPYDSGKLRLGAKVDGLHDPIARKHFRVVIIIPEVVEQTDLSDPATARRFRYTYVASDSDGGWKTEELWP
ncbi:hypothetical protein P154DRAFT_446808 [Amniculicola lignicola CBS 123094]|uniref:Pyridoxamine 5'-phosphate oxidase Alr4036 family FMN-binding domain-containing protein n=1 Tax=Amniculicola lignicola CBS 123094 TaxID=1392246 RepID=A0A6A5W6S3_9PLEO|nr:hypothetical protein P154DRAFT_446808 [Amniculicola lignicola CBS 123094]